MHSAFSIQSTNPPCPVWCLSPRDLGLGRFYSPHPRSSRSLHSPSELEHAKGVVNTALPAKTTPDPSEALACLGCVSSCFCVDSIDYSGSQSRTRHSNYLHLDVCIFYFHPPIPHSRIPSTLIPSSHLILTGSRSSSLIDSIGSSDRQTHHRSLRWLGKNTLPSTRLRKAQIRLFARPELVFAFVTPRNLQLLT